MKYKIPLLKAGIFIGIILIISPIIVGTIGFLEMHHTVKSTQSTIPQPLQQALNNQVTSIYVLFIELYLTMVTTIQSVIYLVPIGIGVLTAAICYLNQAKRELQNPTKNDPSIT